MDPASQEVELAGAGGARTCIGWIVAEGEVDGSDPSGAVEVEAAGADGVFFLGVLTLRQASCLPMMVRASPTSRLEPLAETKCAPETKVG